ncbi:MAG: ParB/RepB/Spo0J family partition protein [Campylobacterales bacterium]
MAKQKNSAQGSMASMFSDVGRLLEIEISKIAKNPKQPRFEAEACDIDELASSIGRHGLIQPIAVCENGDGTYTLIGGERRLLAAKRLGAKKIEAFVFASGLDLDKLGILALVENLDRKKLHPIEVGFAFEALLSGGKYESQKELAEAFGYSDATVSKHLSAVKLPKFVIDAIKLADYRDLEVISALNSLEPDDALTAFNKIAGEGLSREESIMLIRHLRAEGRVEPEPFIIKERSGVYRFRVNSKELSEDKRELLKQKIAEIEALFERG